MLKRYFSIRVAIGILSVLILLLNLATDKVFSQQEILCNTSEGASNKGWILGDVVSVDLENNRLAVTCVNYDTLQIEKITIVVDTCTEYKNISSLCDVKIGDVVSIDYLSDSQGNVALVISVE